MLQFLTGKQPEMIEPERALHGRSQAIVAPGDHFVLGTPMAPPFPDDSERVLLGMGCFWGAERIFWQLGGVHVTAVGYAGGYTPNPTYEETCSGRTGHTEAVLVVFRPAELPFADVLRAFWEGHDPTQGMRQGNDVGTQYRSALYTTTDAQHEAARATRGRYEEALRAAGRAGDGITTEIAPAGEPGRKQPALPDARGSFFYAEEYHQQYLAKNPGGYCGIGGTGVSCPIGTGVSG